MLHSALRFVAGAVIASVLWVLATPAYNAALAIGAQPLLRLDRRLRNAEASSIGAEVQVRGGTAQLDLPRVVIPASQLTYNFVLFAGLFATERGLFRGRAFRSMALAVLILTLTHVAALAIAVESTYATRVVTWSDRNYSPLQQDFWTAAEYAYRLAGMFGIAFGLWWAAGVSDPSASRRSRARSAA